MEKPRQQLPLTGFDNEDEAVPRDDAASQKNETTDGTELVTDGVTGDSSTAVTSRSELKGKTLYIIDAHSLIFQVFHAIAEMTGPKGEPVAAIFGFVRDIFYLLEEKKPDFLICAFDAPGPTFRHEKYEAYKADRGEMPADLAAQLPQIRRLLDAMGIPVLELKLYEADDVIATVTRVCDECEMNCYVVTSDKDCRQLISDHVKLFNVRKNQVIDRAALDKEWGIRPDQVIDFQAMVGDSIDNIPGIPLIGPKLARDLLNQFGTLERVLENADAVSGPKRRQNLIDGRKQALLSRQLVALDRQVPISIDWSAARVGQIDTKRTRELFREYGFRSMVDRLNELTGESQLDVETWQADYSVITSREALDEFVDEVRACGQLAFAVETTNAPARAAEPIGFALATKQGKAYYVPVRGPLGEQNLPLDSALAALKSIFADRDIAKIGQDLKSEMIVLRGLGVQVEGLAFDSMVASYLIEAGSRNHSIDELAKRYLQHETIKIASVLGSGKSQRGMAEVPIDEIVQFACEDADIPLRLRPILESMLEEADLTNLFQEMELPLIDALVEMEFNGIRIDVDLLRQLSERYQQQLAALETEIYTLAGREFNIASPKQLAEVLFTERGLPVLKRTKTGPSTDADVLEQLAREHPLPAKIIEFRQFAKLKNTYVDALPALVLSTTGRVHASFNQSVAATGRLSSSDPNLQNIPVRTAAGREIRAAFLPASDDWNLIGADYSQVELRVLAHCSGDPTLRAAFEHDEDIHALVANQVFGVALDEVTSDMRRTAKAVNFGIIYGQSPFGLAKALDIERDDAAAFIEAYFAQYPKVDEFIREILTRCREDGFVSTIFGRRRAIRGVRPSVSGFQRNLAERTAVNTVIQGSAADLIKRAMINIHRRMKKDLALSRMLLQIHDELIFESPAEEVDALSKLVSEEMSIAADLSVPLKVDLKIGANWAEV